MLLVIVVIMKISVACIPQKKLAT